MSEHGNSDVAIDDLHSAGVPATADRLPALRHLLSSWAWRAGMVPEQAEGLTLAAYEAMANVVEHAYPDSAGTFDLYARHLPAEGTVEVTVVDHGRWRPPPNDPGPLHGRGLPLMRDLANHVDLRPSSAGTTVVLRWALGRT